MNRKKIVIRVLIGCLLLWLGVVAWGFLFAWRPLPHYQTAAEATPAKPILTAKEYELGHRNPFIVQASDSSTSGAVLIFGAVHVNDPNSPSLELIQSEFEQFDPTVVLCEGRMTGLLFPVLMDPVATYGEPGLVRKLAYQNGCRVWTWEPTEEAVVQGLLDQSFDEEQVALRIILTPYFSNLRFGKPNDPEAIILDSIRTKQSWPVVGQIFQDANEVDAAWEKYFPNGPDWRDVSDETTLPGFLGEMDTNLVRDLHLFNCICELAGKGERVFVIAGSSHAVKLEQAITATIQ